MKKDTKNYRNERGSAGVKLTIVLFLLFLVGYAGYNFIPVAYQGASFKEDMHTAVLQGSALPGGNPVGTTQERLKRLAQANNLPPETVIEVKQVSGGLHARAAYSKTVNILPLGIYKYNYRFEHTETPGGFLMK
jgi:hypothetical protein